MLTKGIEVQKYIRASAGRAGLSVVFEDVNQPRHDGKTIYLPRITGATSEQDLKQLMASTDHEVAHDRFSSFEVLQKLKLDPNGLLMFTWNFLEDSRVNSIEAREYRGFRENWDECSAELVQKILERSATESSVISQLMAALLIWESKISAGLFPIIESVASKGTANKDLLDVLNNYSDRLVSCQHILDKEKGTQATYELAYDILNKIGKDCEKELKEAAAKADAKESAKGSKKSKRKDLDGPLERVETASDSDGEGESGKRKADDEFKIIEVKLTEDDLKKFSLSAPDEHSKVGNIGINCDPIAIRSKTHWDLTDYDNFIVVNYPKSTSVNQHPTHSNYLITGSSSKSFIDNYKVRVIPKLVTQENFAQQVRRLIQIRAKVQTQYGVKKGKLDQSRLSRICFDAPGFNEKVFKKRIENKTLDAAVSVLVDMSGSMCGDKVYYALASTLLLNEVCSTLNIPLEIVGFSDNHDKDFVAVPAMLIYKAFADQRVSSESIIEYFSKAQRHMQGNPDGENILWAYDRLIKRKEKRRLLIVMSDGSPAASKDSDGLEAFTLKVVQEIEATKSVEIYGLGLCHHAVAEYYKAHSIVYKPEDIPSKLLELIERKILT